MRQAKEGAVDLSTGKIHDCRVCGAEGNAPIAFQVGAGIEAPILVPVNLFLSFFSTAFAFSLFSTFCPRAARPAVR